MIEHSNLCKSSSVNLSLNIDLCHQLFMIHLQLLLLFLKNKIKKAVCVCVFILLCVHCNQEVEPLLLTINFTINLSIVTWTCWTLTLKPQTVYERWTSWHHPLFFMNQYWGSHWPPTVVRVGLSTEMLHEFPLKKPQIRAHTRVHHPKHVAAV